MLDDPTGLLIVFGLTGITVVLAVLIHFEALSALTSILPKLAIRSRLRLLVLMFGLLSVQLVEIWLFAFVLMLTTEGLHLGQLQHVTQGGLLDYVYYSAVVYTSLGFGDLLPIGHLRFMTAMEALTGLTMVGWSASFIFIEMQTFWRRNT